MVHPFLVRQIVGKEVVVVVVAVVAVRRDRRHLNRKTPGKKVTDLNLSVAALRSNVRHLLREAKRIPPLDKRLWQDRIQAAPKIHAKAILPQIEADGRMPERRVVMTRYVGLKERYDLHRTLCETVAHVKAEVLKISIKAAVIQRDRRFRPSANESVSVRTDILPCYVRQREPHGNFVGEREIRIQNYAVQERMASILSPSIGEDVKTIETVLIQYRSGSLPFRR